MTWRYLATGDNYVSQQFGFRYAANTICGIIPEVCQALIDELSPEFFVLPSTPDQWKKVAAGFEKLWNMPQWLGALDGRHVPIKAPPATGSIYYNYKGFFSINHMALVDSQYKFLDCDIGKEGRCAAPWWW